MIGVSLKDTLTKDFLLKTEVFNYFKNFRFVNDPVKSKGLSKIYLNCLIVEEEFLARSATQQKATYLKLEKEIEKRNEALMEWAK